MKKRGKKIFWTVLIIVIIIALVLILTKAYLVVYLMLGNDLIMGMNADKENLFLEHNQNESVTFSIFATTNPFCRIECTSEFVELSNGDVIENSSFTLSSANLNTQSKQYQLTANRLGIGQELYRFDVGCKSIKTTLCHTTEEVKKRDILITLNYDLNSEEKQFKNDSKSKIQSILQKANYLSYESDALAIAITSIGQIDLNESIIKLNKIKPEILNYIDAGNLLKSLWENQDYLSLEKEFRKNNFNISVYEKDLINLNQTLFSSVKLYNVMAANFSSLKEKIEGFKTTNVTNTTSNEINNAIKDFNSAAAEFSKKSNISAKQIIFENIISKINSIPEMIAAENKSNICCFADGKINNVSLGIELNLTAYSAPAVDFKEPSSQCCLSGKCGDCCDEKCSQENYPIIFLHGHDFNKAVSAEHSLDAFQGIQDALENDGYLNAGSIILSTPDNTQTGIWGMINSPVSVKTSYYFDIYSTSGKGRVIETKTDNLDSYSLRLRDIVNLMRLKTGKNKVIIVAHSMGGLVARKYIQIFGSNDVDRLVMIATPNNGIDENTLRYCSLLGASLECRDMDSTSLFINKLNNAGSTKVPEYNIIGEGCEMGNETGDGIVKKSSAYLEDAENYYVEGSCPGVNYLHSELLNIYKYPRVYEILKDILKK